MRAACARLLYPPMALPTGTLVYNGATSATAAWASPAATWTHRTGKRAQQTMPCAREWLPRPLVNLTFVRCSQRLWHCHVCGTVMYVALSWIKRHSHALLICSAYYESCTVHPIIQWNLIYGWWLGGLRSPSMLLRTFTYHHGDGACCQ